MRLLNGKISAYNNLPLFLPPDNGGSNGGTQNTNGGQETQNNGQQQTQELDLDSESLVDDLLGEEGGDEDDEIDFDVGGDDDEEDPDEADRIKTSTANLGQWLNQKISGIGLKPEDIPSDFDASDSTQVAKLLSQANQSVAKEVVSVIPEILKHALGIIVPKLEKKIQTASVQTSKKADVTKAFNSLGLKGADRALGQTLYKTAMQRGMNPEKAARATTKALSQLRGGSDKGFNSNRSGGNSNNSSGIKTGSNALDDMFGKM